jgi:kinesin family protein 15
MDGYNASIITVGQTDSGKTYLLHGPKASQKQASDAQGLLHTISQNIFESLGTKTSQRGYQYAGTDRIGFQAFEVYSELARDLLDPSRDGVTIDTDDFDGVAVKGLPFKWVANAQDLNQWINLVGNLACPDRQ